MSRLPMSGKGYIFNYSVHACRNWELFIISPFRHDPGDFGSGLESHGGGVQLGSVGSGQSESPGSGQSEPPGPVHMSHGK